MEALVKSVKVEVSNLKPEEDFKEVSRFVKLGWTVKSIVPVTDNNKPHLVFVLEKSKTNTMLYVFLSVWFVIITLIEIML